MLPMQVAQTYVQPTLTEIRTAEAMGISHGQFYCYAMQKLGVKNTDEMVKAFSLYAPEPQRLGVVIYSEWQGQGRTFLVNTFLSSSLKVQQEFCPAESNRYYQNP